MNTLYSWKTPYLVFLGDIKDRLSAKTALGLKEWVPHDCVGQFRMAPEAFDAGLPDLSLEQAVQLGAQSLVVGVANRGGVLSPSWLPTLAAAIEAGLDIVNGMHGQLSEIPTLCQKAKQHGRQLIDLRRPPSQNTLATGLPRSGKRLLTVGTDCSVGKMFTALSIHRELQKRNIPASFRATGQTGILIAGQGICVDAIVSDFIAGAAEELCPAASENHWDLVEGQGSLMHPSYAAVTMGLIHGAQPDYLVLCHEPNRPHMRGLLGRPLPSLSETLDLHLAAARVVNPAVQCAGISLNTSLLSPSEKASLCRQLESEFSLPVCDPKLDGVSSLIDPIFA